MTLARILTLTIFVAMFVLVVRDKIERHIVTLSCGVLTLFLVFGVGLHSLNTVIETINVKGILSLDFWYASGESGESTSGINWATIIFLASMMIMVEGMAKAGFFRWLCMKLAKMVNFKTIPLFITFMIMSAILSMFIDSITVILFLAAVTVELAKLLKFDPVPMILAEIFCANLGGSATMCGDPPNIIIGTSLGYSFASFLTNTGLIAAVALAVVLLVTHSMTHLTVAFIGTFIAVITLIASGKSMVSILKKVDYKTLLFFVGLFMVVGGLEQTGVLEIVANFIGEISGGNVCVMVAIILWVSAIASAFIDNIPFAATMFLWVLI